MGVRADIEALKDRQDLTPAEKRDAVRELRAQAVHTAAKERVFNIVRGQNTFVVTISDTLRVPGGVRFNLVVTRNGKTLPIDPDQVIINPPLLVEDPAGDIVKPIMRRKAGSATFPPEFEQIGERRYREDAAAALKAAIIDVIRGALG